MGKDSTCTCNMIEHLTISILNIYETISYIQVNLIFTQIKVNGMNELYLHSELCFRILFYVILHILYIKKNSLLKINNVYTLVTKKDTPSPAPTGKKGYVPFMRTLQGRDGFHCVDIVSNR